MSKNEFAQATHRFFKQKNQKYRYNNEPQTQLKIQMALLEQALGKKKKIDWKILEHKKNARKI